MEPVRPKEIRYIKLGPGGRWQRCALGQGEVYFGMPVDPQDLIEKRDWKSLARRLREMGRSPSMSSYIAREYREFKTFGSDCLWITFGDGYLWWGFADPKVVVLGGDGSVHGTRMRRIIGGWRNSDITGKPLAQAALSTKLTQVASYRHTMCGVREADYLVRKINAIEEPLLTRAAEVRRATIDVAADAIASLHWADFETLVDLIFARTGWQRISRVGGAQKDLDLEIEQPSTLERAFVQVKSKADQATLDRCLACFVNGNWNRLFFVCHSPTGTLMRRNHPGVHIWTGEILASAVVRAGLFDWVVQKAA